MVDAGIVIIIVWVIIVNTFLTIIKLHNSSSTRSCRPNLCQSMVLSRFTTRFPRLNQILQHFQLPGTTVASPATLRPSHTASYATMVDHSEWKFNHTMLRVKDPKKSIEYYNLLGLTLINKMDFPDWKFTNYFLGKLKSCQRNPRE